MKDCVFLKGLPRLEAGDCYAYLELHKGPLVLLIVVGGEEGCNKLNLDPATHCWMISEDEARKAIENGAPFRFHAGLGSTGSYLVWYGGYEGEVHPGRNGLYMELLMESGLTDEQLLAFIWTPTNYVETVTDCIDYDATRVAGETT